MIVYHSQGQPLEANDIILISKSYYVVTYDMRICTFILYPLSGHQIEKQHIGILNDVDWEWVGYSKDALENNVEFQEYIYRMQGGLDLYLSQIKTNLSI